MKNNPNAKRIYVASSWRNPHQPAVVLALRDAGHEVYDFRNPAPGNTGFSWSDVDPEWKAWTPEQMVEALHHPIAEEGFNLDMSNLMAADATVLVMPCGRSAHLEAGYACGAGQTVIILQTESAEPELMYAMADAVVHSLPDVLSLLDVP